jgi:hypothetical protein
MATITANPSNGITLNVLDPNTWVGGVVPGPNDVAQLPAQNYYTRINKPYIDGYFLGTTYEERIQVDSTSNFPSDSGSFYVSSPFTGEIDIKINYTGSDSDEFFSCSIDPEFVNRVKHQNSGSWPNDILFKLPDNDYIYKELYKYELTGSGVWHVGQVKLNMWAQFTIKDDAHLKLDGSTITYPNINFDSNSWGKLYILDQATVEVTGSTTRDRTGIYLNDRDNCTVIISGSENFSSSYFPTECTSGSVLVEVDDPTAFGPKDYISITEPWDITQRATISSSGDINMWYQGEDYNYGENSWHGYQLNGWYYDGKMEDEIARVHSVSGSYLRIAKLHAKEGAIHEDLGLYDYNTFVETFGETPPVFTGNKRVVLVSSFHKDFKPNTTLIVSESICNILYSSKYLSQSQFIDFTTGTTRPEEVFAWDSKMNSGSGLTVGSSVYDREDYWLDQIWTTSSYNGLNCFRIDFDKCYSPTSPRTYMNLMVSGTFLQEYEITISGSTLRDNGNGDGFLGVGVGGHPTFRNTITRADTRTSAYYNLGWIPWLTLDGKYSLYHNQAPGDYNKVQIDNNDYWGENDFLISDWTLNDDLSFNPSASFELKITQKDGLYRTYFNNFQTSEFIRNLAPSPLWVGLYRFSSLYNINIKEWKELLILDTEDEFTQGDSIVEGGLIYTHDPIHKISNLGNAIKDARGYKNLLWEWNYTKGKTSLLPYQHNVVASNQADYTTGLQYINNPGQYQWGAQLAFQAAPRPWSFSVGHAGVGYFITYDLTQPVTFDTFAIQYVQEYRDDEVNNRIYNVRLDVSDDGENWTTVKAAANDDRYFTGVQTLRRFTLDSGPTTARFVRYYSEGSVRSTENDHMFFGLYNTNGQGNTIELYDASNFKVGDKILFWSKQLNAELWKEDQTDSFIDWPIITGVSTGATTNTDVAGGLVLYHEITAIDGNVITLDRPVEYYHLNKDTVVLKLNLGNINFTGNYKNRNSVYLYRSDGAPLNCTIKNANWTDLAENYGIRIDNNYMGTPMIIENCFFNNQTGDTGAIYAGSLWKNNYSLNSGNDYTMRSFYVYTPQTQYCFNYHSYCRYVYHEFSEGGVNDKACYNFNITRNHATSQIYRVQDRNISYSDNGNQAASITIKNNYIGNLAYGWYTVGFSDDFGITRRMQIYDNYVNAVGGYRGWNPNTYNDEIALIQNQIEMPKFSRDWNYFGVSDNYRLYGSFIGWSGLRTGRSQGLYLNNNPDLNKPSILIGGYQYYVIVPEEDYYRIYIGGSNQEPFTQQYNLNLFKSTFNISKETDVNINLSFDYRFDILQKHSLGTNSSATDVAQQRVGKNWVQPHIVLFDKQMNVVKHLGSFSSVNWDTVSIDETLTLQPDTYILGIIQHTMYSTAWRHARLMDYKNMNYHLSSTTPENISVYNDTFDIHKMFASRQGLTNSYTKGSLGPDAVVRAANSLGTGTIKFRKVKL